MEESTNAESNFDPEARNLIPKTPKKPSYTPQQEFQPYHPPVILTPPRFENRQNSFPRKEVPSNFGFSKFANRGFRLAIDLNASPCFGSDQFMDFSSVSSSTSSCTLTQSSETTASFLGYHQGVSWRQSLDLEGLSCSQILNLADCIGTQQSQTETASSSSLKQEAAAPGMEEEKDMKNKNNEALNGSPNKTKKRKSLMDLNKMPGEKRQNKFYWPKIDDEKKEKSTPIPKTQKTVTPAAKIHKLVTPKPKKEKLPKTPKPITPKLNKPKRKYVKKCMKSQAQVESNEDSVCKRALTFENSDQASIGSNDRDISLNDDRVTSQVEELEVIDNSTADLNLYSLNLYSFGNELRVDNNVEERKPKITRVYCRRPKENKCLNECKKLKYHFQMIDKRKRIRRGHKSILELKLMERFTKVKVMDELVERIRIVRGRKKMVLPSDVIVDLKYFGCVLNLLQLSFPLNLRSKKKRSMAKRVAQITSSESQKDTSNEHTEVVHFPCVSNDNTPTPGGDTYNEEQVGVSQTQADINEHTKVVPFPCSEIETSNDNTTTPGGDTYNEVLVGGSETHADIIEPKIVEEQVPVNHLNLNIETQSQIVQEQVSVNHLNIETQSLEKSCQDVNVPDPKDEKTTMPKEGCPASKGKGKGKRHYSTPANVKEIDVLQGPSWEHIMDNVTLHFKSMKVSDDPSKMKNWIVLNNLEDRDGTDERSYDAKLEEERRKLLSRIAKFISVMQHTLGRKDFVKWNGSVLDSVVGVFLTQNVSDILSSNAYMELAARYPVKKPSSNIDEVSLEDCGNTSTSSSQASSSSVPQVIIEFPDEDEEGEEGNEDGPNVPGVIVDEANEGAAKYEESANAKGAKEEVDKMDAKAYDAAINEMFELLTEYDGKLKGKVAAEQRDKLDWEKVRSDYVTIGPMNRDVQDSVDWDAVRTVPVADIAQAIRSRGQHEIIADKIQKTLNRLVDKHGTLDLEWLRDAPPQVAKAYLLSFYGLGLKSVECLQLLTLHHDGFPVDVNIARIAVRLGWVPLKPLPYGLLFHHLVKYPLENDIQRYLWPRLCQLDQEILYKLHYQMITFGKVFCLKKSPNCGACPLKGECKYYASVVASKLLGLPEPGYKRKKQSKKKITQNPFDHKRKKTRQPLSLLVGSSNTCSQIQSYSTRTTQKREPIVEMPPSPQPHRAEQDLPDIEDFCRDDKGKEIIEIDLNSEEFRRNMRSVVEENSLIPLGNDMLSRALATLSPENDYEEFRRNVRSVVEENSLIPLGNDMLSRALVTLSPENAYFPLPKHLVKARLRTEHQVYEIPDGHKLLNNVEKRVEKDPSPYLLAVWTTEQKGSNGDDQASCSTSCSSDESLTVLGTLLIPARTANRGSFALNGTYFQVNEVFADYESSLKPMVVPREWLCDLRRRTLYCGTSVHSIFRGLTWEEIRHCSWEGFICTRGFNRKTRAPQMLHVRLHERSKLQKKEDNK